MNDMWHVWTDGSAICDQSMLDGGRRFPGGWAAVIEHDGPGKEGYAIYGREANTTNVRMELRAAIEGLREVPANARVTLHFDCTVILSVRDRWQRGIPIHESGDGDLWAELAHEFGLRYVIPRLLGKGLHPVHRRAHGYAGAQARAQARGLPPNAEPLTDENRLRRERRKEARSGFGLSDGQKDALEVFGRALDRRTHAQRQEDLVEWARAHKL